MCPLDAKYKVKSSGCRNGDISCFSVLIDEPKFSISKNLFPTIFALQISLFPKPPGLLLTKYK